LYEIALSVSIIILTASGQIYLKLAAINQNKFKKIVLLTFGYSIFLITIFISYLLMKVIPMKFFTIIMSLNYIAVMFASHKILNEKMTYNKLLGTLLVSLGVFVFMLDKII